MESEVQVKPSIYVNINGTITFGRVLAKALQLNPGTVVEIRQSTDYPFAVHLITRPDNDNGKRIRDCDKVGLHVHNLQVAYQIRHYHPSATNIIRLVLENTEPFTEGDARYWTLMPYKPAP